MIESKPQRIQLPAASPDPVRLKIRAKVFTDTAAAFY
jgi:hypothetical protein